tara:strand:- start:4450 stop:5535 length:1086 start_codon:yes stop_codon:yes gene_type:complete
MKGRLLSIDVLRGLTIIFMIIVNQPGSWDYVYSPLLHAKWNGLTPTDYIFPMFLFIVGVSIVLSMSKRLNSVDKSSLIKKILWRALKIYLVGLFLWIWPAFDLGNIRWTGVLQRISVVFLFCGLIYLFFKQKQQVYIAATILILYWIIMVFTPVPGIGVPDLNIPERNWAHYIDSLYLPGVMWQGTWDPEGILSTFPSIVTGIFGLIAGGILVSKKDIKDKLINLFLIGVILVFIGDAISWSFPVNKNLWSTSYTCLMGGMSFLLTAAFIYIIDVLGYKKFKFAHVFGVNSIFCYVLAGVLSSIFYSNYFLGFYPNKEFFNLITGLGISDKLVSFMYAVIYVLIIFLPAYILFKKKIFIKL